MAEIAAGGEELRLAQRVGDHLIELKVRTMDEARAAQKAAASDA